MEQSEIFYRIALGLINGIGPVKYKKLIKHFHTAEQVFEENEKALHKSNILNRSLVEAIKKFQQFDIVEKEMQFIEKNNIKVLCFDDHTYPNTLKQCSDSPIILFQKGNFEWNQQHTLSIIGTRAMTEYGKKMCEDLIEKFKPYNIAIVSGLAYGVDITAHRQSLQLDIPTIGIVAHGLQTIYPTIHNSVAQKMQEQGAIVSEYMSGTNLEKGNFPSRNRIVAGISEATIVIETDMRGGSMITAELAFSYNKEIFCFPGRANDIKSAGCNYLIRKLKAQLITKAEDLIEEMNWCNTQKTQGIQQKLFIELTAVEQKIYDTVCAQEKIFIDKLIYETQLSNAEIASALLNLEMQKIIKILPGKIITNY